MISSGKTILFGEHAVVYGFSAIVVSLESLKVKVTIRNRSESEINHSSFIKNIFTILKEKYNLPLEKVDIAIDSEIPVGSGLGSSAATANAIFQALLTHFNIKYTKKALVALVQESEKYAHGNPSGVDAASVVYGGVLEFQKKDDKLTFSSVKTEAFKDKTFFLIQSGQPVETTKEMVLRVKKLVEEYPSKKSILKKIDNLTQKAIKGIKKNTFVPSWLNENEKLLEELEVVSQTTRDLLEKIYQVRGYAKITGAGGFVNGSGIILAYCENPQTLRELIKKNNWIALETHIGTI